MPRELSTALLPPRHPWRSFRFCRVAVVAAVLLAGCDLFSPSDRQFLTSQRTQNLIRQAREPVEEALEENFGTPENLVVWSRLPINYGGPEGQFLKSGRKLYMKHCIHCHGVSGDGNGPTAKYLNPRPRDYRLGVFKFTSTAQREKATREDLKGTVKRGIPGTYMPSFKLLEDKQSDAIVEYVRWLAIRGEFEKKLVDELEGDYSRQAVAERKQAGETDAEIKNELASFLADEFSGIIDWAADDLTEAWTRAEQPASLVLPETGRDETVEQIAASVAEWMQKNGKSLKHGQLDAFAEREGTQGADESVPKKYVAVRVRLAAETDDSIKGRDLLWIGGTLKGRKYKILAYDPQLKECVLAPQRDAPELDIRESPAKGSRFVVGKQILDRLAYVIQHGARMSELLKMADADREKLQEQLVDDSPRRGRSLYLGPKTKCATCHGPRGRGDGELTRQYAKIPGTNDEYPTPGLYDLWHNKIVPRDLTRGVYRGGRRPIDLYRRFSVGIKGTPMPAFGPGVLSDDEIWDLVNYVMSIPSEDRRSPPNSRARRVASK